MEKVNFPKNTLLYVNQAYLTVKMSKNFFYCDDYVLGKIVKSLNTPQDISSYILKDNVVKMFRPCYDPETGEFCSLHQTVGFLVVRGSPEEVLFNYGFNKEKSKVFYSHYWRKIPNSFSGTIFNRHRTMIESGEIEGEMSNIFFLPPLYNWQFRGHKQISEQRLNFSNRNYSTTVKQLKWNSFWSIQAWHLWYWKKHHERCSH